MSYYGTCIEQHNKFLVLYRQQHWELSLRWLNDLRDEFNGAMADYYAMMEKRIEVLREEDLPQDWDGVYRATTK